VASRITSNDCVMSSPTPHDAPEGERVLTLRIPCVHYDAVSARVKALAEGGSSTPLRLSDIDELGLRDALVAEMTKKQE